MLEPHGLYDAAQEVTIQSGSGIEAVSHERGRTASVVTLNFTDGTSLAIGIAEDADPRRHRVRAGGRTYRWSGPVEIFRE